MKKIIFITGATSGIGEATARAFSEIDCNLILSGRREKRLLKLKNELEQEKGVRVLTLCMDVRNKEEVKDKISALPKEWQSIDVLVNNAGLAAGLSPLQEGDIDDWERMIDTNIKGLLYVTRSVAPIMIKNGKGHIVNIGSIAGKEVYPNGNVYCATKHAVDALSKAMRIDMVGKSIRVSQICPGAAETEFSLVRFRNDEEKAKKVYEGYQSLKAEDIAKCILFVTTLPQHINVNDMLVMPTAQANSSIFNKEG